MSTIVEDCSYFATTMNPGFFPSFFHLKEIFTSPLALVIYFGSTGFRSPPPPLHETYQYHGSFLCPNKSVIANKTMTNRSSPNTGLSEFKPRSMKIRTDSVSSCTINRFDNAGCQFWNCPIYGIHTTNTLNWILLLINLNSCCSL